jgi:hypothetical protein
VFIEPLPSNSSFSGSLILAARPHFTIASGFKVESTEKYQVFRREYFSWEEE